jgi:glycogen debranching enzyme
LEWTVHEDLRAQGEAFGIRVRAPEGTVSAGSGGCGVVTFTVDAEPGRTWCGTIEFVPVSARDEGRPGPAVPAATLGVQGTPAWQASVASALDDLRALHVDVPALDLRYLAAGAPWFMALFGRDTLLSSWEGLIAGSDVSLDVLRSLARYQGVSFDGGTGEQPGRILHELRTGGAEVFGVASGRPYYGTVDASPLFVMLLAEAHRWGADDDAVRALLPAARAALDWCAEHGDVDGDGFVEYAADPGGLVNQGWKDSGDSMVHADGTFAPAPIALSEVQAYLWAARRGLADLEERLGDPARAPGLRADADALRAAFREAFWLAEHGLLAMALDADKRPLAVASSNMGHCLWAGILDDEVGRAVADRLGRPDMTTAWGLRTLGSAERAYNPLGYHLGSVWPHDTAIAVDGLRRYGHGALASRIAGGVLAAAEMFGWRLPELFAGFDADEVAVPVPYPVACSPQAWAAGVPLLLLRALLGLDPDVPRGRVRVDPRLPEGTSLTVRGIPLGKGHLALRVAGSEVEVLDAPAGLDVVVGDG